MPNWLWFLIGFVAAFVVSFGFLVGWWFLLTREAVSPPPRTQDLDRIKRQISGYEYERRN